MFQERLQSAAACHESQGSAEQPHFTQVRSQQVRAETSAPDQAVLDFPEGLTDKQCEALDLVLCHMSSKEIAQHLGVSPRAVDQRLDAARLKLGAATRVEAAKIYQRHKLRSTCDQITSEPFPLPPEARQQHDDISADDEPGFTLQDAGAWLGTFHEEGPGSPSAAELKPIVLGKGLRLGLIVAGALAMMMLVLVLLAIVQALEAIIP